MHIVRFIFIISFVFFFTNIKAANNIKFENKLFSKEKSCHLKKGEISFDTENDRCCVLKRKYKSRGIEVANPYVSNVPCNKVSVYSKFLSIPVKDNYTSFLYCVDRKRGPPIV